MDREAWWATICVTAKSGAINTFSFMGIPGGSGVKNLPAVQEMRFLSNRWR